MTTPIPALLKHLFNLPIRTSLLSLHSLQTFVHPAPPTALRSTMTSPAPPSRGSAKMASMFGIRASQDWSEYSSIKLLI